MPTGRKPAGLLDAAAQRADRAPSPARGGSFMLAPDFEAAAGLTGHRHHKPERAWRRLRSLTPEQVPPPLLDAVRGVLALAREGR